MIHPDALCARIAKLRRACGMTQTELAQRMQITPQAVSKWERGITCPNLVCLDELADVLGVSLQKLLTGEGEATS